MSWQDIATAAIGMILTILGWIMRILWSKVDNMERALPETYARRDELDKIEARSREDMHSIVESLRRIEDKLDRKVDR